MSILDTLKDTMCAAVDTISYLAQDFIEKNRTKAKLNRLRTVIKSECELMNRAYIALGKDYYEQLKKGGAPKTEREEKLMQLIDNCKAKIAKARDCYRRIVESQNAFLYTAEEDNGEDFEKQDVVDITVACSNENEYASNPFESKEDPKAEESSEGEESSEDEESPEKELF